MIPDLLYYVNVNNNMEEDLNLQLPDDSRLIINIIMLMSCAFAACTSNRVDRYNMC